MKIVSLSVSSLLLGAFLAVGCGGPSTPDETASAPAPSVSGGSSSMAPDDASGEAWFPDSPDSEKGTVGQLKACCYIKCSNNPNWYGPYHGVDYGNCINFGKYKCANNGWGYVGAKWDQC